MSFTKLLSVLLGAAVLLCAPAPSTAAADPYQPLPRPSCVIKVHKAAPGTHVKIVVGARLNAADQPSGTIATRVSLDNGRSWTRTVHTDGSYVTILGPVVPRGTHVVTTRFVPDNATESLPCQGRQDFNVSRGNDNDDRDDNDNDNGGNDDDNGGLLPNTGGPHLLWLLIGLGLVGGGVGTAAYARRRGDAPSPVVRPV